MWETCFIKVGKNQAKVGNFLGDFEKVSHPLSLTATRVLSHRWETGKLFFQLFFVLYKSLCLAKIIYKKSFPLSHLWL